MTQYGNPIPVDTFIRRHDPSDRWAMEHDVFNKEQALEQAIREGWNNPRRVNSNNSAVTRHPGLKDIQR